MCPPAPGAPATGPPAARRRLAIVGSVGIPARYGGFETLTEQLVAEARRLGLSQRITVYCSRPQTHTPRPRTHNGARLRYVPLRANGLQSLPYDLAALAHAAATRHDTILLLGVAGAMALPALTRTRMRLLVHVDGIEWQRAKWRGPARRFLRWSEGLAARHADAVIADNPAIADHLAARYGVNATQIAYGGEQATATSPGDISDLDLPPAYALCIARIEPENSIATILAAFAEDPPLPLVVVGNWDAPPHGRALKARHADTPGLHLVAADYDPARLRAIRDRARLYIHGHSAGGTNPSLVEMMHLGKPVLAFDTAFNRATTRGEAAFFTDPANLRAAIPPLLGPAGYRQATRLRMIAEAHYRWPAIARAYFDLAGLTEPAAKASPAPATAL